MRQEVKMQQLTETLLVHLSLVLGFPGTHHIEEMLKNHHHSVLPVRAQEHQRLVGSHKMLPEPFILVNQGLNVM